MLRYVLVFLLLFLAACDSGGDDDTTIIPSTANDLSTVDLERASILVWYSEGREPSQQSEPGQIAMMDSTGEMTVVLDLPDETEMVIPCGEQATSADARYFAFYAGNRTSGQLYQISNTDTPESIRSIHPSACLGMGTFAYSPDSDQFGFIDFEENALENDFPRGVLRIVNASNREQQLEYQNVAAFDMGDSFTAFVSGFSTDDDRVTEAGVFRWTSGEPDEIATLFPQDDCRFEGGNLHVIDDTSMVALMGQTCPGSRHSWLLYTIIDGTATEILSGTTGSNGQATYGSGVRVNGVFGSLDGAAVYMSYPNGSALNVVDWQQVKLDAVDDDDVVIENGIMPRLVANRPIDLTRTSTPVVSLSGRWVGIATTDGELDALDLTTPDLPPIKIGSSGQISGMAFTQASDQLLFISGGTGGSDNSLFSLNLETATDRRVVRGNYAPQIVISPDGTFTALAEWQSNDTMNLTIVNLTTDEAATLFTGGTEEDGRVTERHFAYPLSWRR